MAYMSKILRNRKATAQSYVCDYFITPSTHEFFYRHAHELIEEVYSKTGMHIQNITRNNNPVRLIVDELISDMPGGCLNAISIAAGAGSF